MADPTGHNTIHVRDQEPWPPLSAALDLDNFARRVAQNAADEANRVYWLRRADTLENAISQPIDQPGTEPGHHAKQAERDRLLASQALACRRHATLTPDHAGPWPWLGDPDSWQAHLANHTAAAHDAWLQAEGNHP